MSSASNSTRRQSLMSDTNEICQRRRRVCFSTEANDICLLKNVPPASTMTTEEKDSAWYTYEDMVQMKENAKALAHRLRLEVCRKTSSTPPLSDDDDTQTRKRRLDEKYPLDFTTSSSAAIEDNINETYRGLELRIFLGRQVKKYFASRKVLEYQRKYKHMIAIAVKNGNPNMWLIREIISNKLACVSAKYSRWARDMALLTGQQDFKGAYEQLKNPILASSFEQLSQFPSKKRRTNDFSSSVGSFEIKCCSKKQIYDSHKPPGNRFIPIDGMRCDMLPVKIF
mmetsp:Transcript_10286/g.12064  ORF Transcript_10286/g.12064 Transcript_10286/m.12064 type:complete len:283 (-) Transcript_10286:30-878(-)